MPLNRLKNILKANLNASFNSSENYQENINFEPEESINQRPVDKVKQKEFQYLANLELNDTATFEDIKSSYKKLMKKYHPDRFQDNEDKRKLAETISIKLNEAYTYFEKKFNNK